MGMTVHYSGQLADPSRLEELEDLVIDLVLEIGGNVEVWRSASVEKPDRVVRGLLVNLEPGQETMSLLFSPEGWLISLIEIKEVERGESGENSTCFVKTQFGTPVGHAALVELLTILRDRFIPSLQVEDETGYWKHRDARQMAESIQRNARAIDALASALEETSLSHEALEDPEIVATRIERVAQILHGRLQEPDATQTAGELVDDDFTKRWSDIEAEWTELVRQNDARTRRTQREIEEQFLAGKDAEDALDEVLGDPPGEDANATRESEGQWCDTSEDSFAAVDELAAADGESFETSRKERDPLLDRATRFYVRLMELAKTDSSPGVVDLLRHAGEVCGGLAQALPLPPPYEFDPDERGLAVFQLKRALRGAAFVRGVLINLSYAAQNDGEQYKVLREEIEAIQGEIIDSLQQARPAPEG
ncbi:hypothetical protein [Aeoliella sp.]|uniref:hypothetical protein n=1 Tax=Aeoliella sp. TaxID=2795800 RepID=UPI003CCBD1DE